MKRLTFLLIFLITLNVQGKELSKTYDKQITVDNEAATDSFFIYFPQPSSIFGRTSGGGVKDDTTSNTENPVMFDGLLSVKIKLDSLKASTVLDSIWTRVRAIDKDGYPYGTMFYLDFASNDSSSAIDYIENAVPDNRTGTPLQTTLAGWADLNNLISTGAHGIVVTGGMVQTAVADSVLIDYDITIGIPK